MRTVVDVSDELLARADRLAQQLGLSRSELFTRALTELLARRDSIETGPSDEIGSAVEDQDEFSRLASIRILRDTEW
jgi:metal-responsive CopG/Arc/MetJ family transcriptional regulator